MNVADDMTEQRYLQAQVASLAGRGLVIDIPAKTPEGAPQKVQVRELAGLRGQLTREPDGLRLSDVFAERATLDDTALCFGQVQVGFSGTGAVTDAAVSMHPRGGGKTFDFHVATMVSEALRVATPRMEVGGRTTLTDGKVEVRSPQGKIAAKTLSVEGFALRLSSFSLRVPRLEARDVIVDWGPGHFSLEGQEVLADALVVSHAGGEERLQGVEVGRLSWNNGNLELLGLRAQAVETEATFGAHADKPSTRPAGSRAERPKSPWFSPAMLDHLSGHLHGDVTVETAVPVIRSRKATHRLQLDIDAGAFDYRLLESGLSPLENSLLDFSLRDDALVLELGVPLLPTRGHGKSLLRWPLPEDEIALARNAKMRLARLPKVQRDQGKRTSPPASGTETTKPSKAPGKGLQSLQVQELHGRLTLTPYEDLEAVVRTLAGNMQIDGNVTYDREQPHSAGQIVATSDGWQTTLHGAPVGTRFLDAEAVSVARMPRFALGFEGLSPRNLQAQFTKLSADRIALRL